MSGRLSRDNLGLPQASGRGPLLAAMLVDSLGSGLFLPFALVFFVRTSTIPLAAVGLGLSLASAATLPVGPWAGGWSDRLGARRLTLLANLLESAGFTGDLFVRSLPELIGFTVLVYAGGSLFWTANPALLTSAADPGERPRWFGLQRAVRNAGIGLGGLLAALSVGLLGTAGLRLLAAANAASFVVAALLLLTWRGEGPVKRTRPGRPAVGLRTALQDRRLLALVSTNLVFILCLEGVELLLAIYLARDLGQPVYLAGVMFTLNTALVVALQTSATRWLESRPPIRVLRLAAGLIAAALLGLWGLLGVPPGLVVPLLVAVVAVFTGAEILHAPAMQEALARAAPEGSIGRYAGVNQLAWSLGGTLGPFALTAMLARADYLPWLCLVILAVGAAIGLWRLGASPEPGTSPAPGMEMSV